MMFDMGAKSEEDGEDEGDAEECLGLERASS